MHDHILDHFFERDPGCPSAGISNLGAVTDVGQSFLCSASLPFPTDEMLCLKSQATKGSLGKFPDGSSMSGGYDEIIPAGLLENQPHGLHVVLRRPPVDQRIRIEKS